jgi:hypothetical protein
VIVGCWASQAATVAAERSGSRAMHDASHSPDSIQQEVGIVKLRTCHWVGGRKLSHFLVHVQETSLGMARRPLAPSPLGRGDRGVRPRRSFVSALEGCLRLEKDVSELRDGPDQGFLGRGR